MESISVEHVTIVRSTHKHSDWQLDDCTIGGMKVVKLDRRDSRLRKWASGLNQYDVRVSETIDQLATLRAEASKKTAGLLCNVFGSAKVLSDWQRRRESDKLKTTENSPPDNNKLVDIILPSFAGADGGFVGEVTAKVEYKLTADPVVAMVVETDVMRWLAARMNCVDASQRSGKREAQFTAEQPGVYWHKGRQAYVAKSETETGVKWKVLRPDDQFDHERVTSTDHIRKSFDVKREVDAAAVEGRCSDREPSDDSTDVKAEPEELAIAVSAVGEEAVPDDAQQDPPIKKQRTFVSFFQRT